MSRMVLAGIAAIALVALSSVPALAKGFRDVDANHDGVVTRIEAMGRFPTLPDEIFNMADVNHDGVLNSSEYNMLEGLSGAIGGMG